MTYNQVNIARMMLRNEVEKKLGMVLNFPVPLSVNHVSSKTSDKYYYQGQLVGSMIGKKVK